MIRQAKFLFTALIAVLALAAASSAVASATEMTLPEFKNTESGSSLSGEDTLAVEGGASIKCANSFSSIAFGEKSHNLGKYTGEFAECAEGGEACHSLGGTGGTVTISGEWHLVLDIVSTVHLWMMDFVLPATDPHVECASGAVKLFLISGSLLGVLEPGSGKATTEYKVALEQAKGVQKQKTYENNKDESVTDILEAGEEGGKEKKAGLESTSTIVCFPKENEIKN